MGLSTGQKGHGVRSSIEQSFFTTSAMEGRMGLFMSFVNKQDLLIDSTFSCFPFTLDKTFKDQNFLANCRGQKGIIIMYNLLKPMQAI